MIKLNNKNITYVALADTNNSLKAPKEIWYADSSNSVKLVYRRKDALIEGEDYEKYHWLEGRNGAYINTNYHPIVGTDIFSVYFHYDGTKRNPDGVEQCIFGCQDGPYGPTVIRAYINSVNNLSAVYRNVSDNYYPSTDVNSNNIEITDLKLDGSNFSFVANGVTYSFSNNNIQIETMHNSIWVFKNMQKFNSNCYFHGDISYFKITNASSNTKMNLIPCKLLKPVPKWLDANGIRRQVGECGMIDLVSGKFYGNVANSGTFKAVNLAEGVDYEVHQWLVGDGSAYIDTLINPSFGDELNATFTFSSKPTVVNIYILAASDNVNRIGFCSGGYFRESGNPQLLIRNNPAAKNGYIEWSSNSLGTTIKEYYMYMKLNNAQMPDTIVKADGVICNYNKIVGYNRISEVPTTSYKIGKEYSEQTGLDTVKLRNVTISSKINLIPIKLLKPIPAKYDANGIARQAGECGMYDTVNDKFYGNVASSGTFSVSDDS